MDIEGFRCLEKLHGYLLGHNWNPITLSTPSDKWRIVKTTKLLLETLGKSNLGSKRVWGSIFNNYLQNCKGYELRTYITENWLPKHWKAFICMIYGVGDLFNSYT